MSFHLQAKVRIFACVYVNVYIEQSNLRKVSPRNGGIHGVYFVRWEDVATWPDIDPDTGKITTPFILRSGGLIYYINGCDKDRVFQETQKQGSAGNYFEQTVNLPLVGDSDDNLLSFQTMIFSDYLVLVKDRSGLLRLLGNEDAGCKVQQGSYTSGDSDTSRKRALQFFFQSQLPAPIYDAEIPGIIDPCAGHLNQPDYSQDYSPEFHH